MTSPRGLLWMGWAGFNGGDPYTANIDSSIVVLNTYIYAATNLLVWTCLDVFIFRKPSVIRTVQGMITRLVCITPDAGIVQGCAAIVMGLLSGSIPWFTMMVVHKRWTLLQNIDDILGVFHTHVVACLLRGVLTGIFVEPTLCELFLPVTNSRGVVYGGSAFATTFAHLDATTMLSRQFPITFMGQPPKAMMILRDQDNNKSLKVHRANGR